MHPVIVGIDPGTTSAFAILDFDFRLIAARSRKNYSLAGIISDIYTFGNPIIVGTDKKEVPSFIREFCQKTGAKVYAPRYDTKKGEKDHLVKTKYFHKQTKNTHEVDALASAIYAYNEYLPLIKKIKSFALENGKAEIMDKIFIKVIGEEKNISDAVAEIEKKPEKKSIVQAVEMIKPPQIELTGEEKQIILLKGLVSKLRDEIKDLKSENNMLKDKKVDISRTTKKIISFKENRALMTEDELKAAKKEIERKNKILKSLNLFISGLNGFTIIKRLDNLGREEFESKKKILNIMKGDILYVEDISIAGQNVISELNGKIEVIFYKTGSNNFLENRFTLVARKDLKMIETKFFAKIKNEDLESALDRPASKKISLREIVDDYKNERLRDNI